MESRNGHEFRERGNGEDLERAEEDAMELHLVQPNDVGVLEQLQRGDLPLYLLVDLHGEDALAVEDLDGEGAARLGVPRQPHLAEMALPERPPHLVLPHPHSSAARHHAPAAAVLARRPPELAAAGPAALGGWKNRGSETLSAPRGGELNLRLCGARLSASGSVETSSSRARRGLEADRPSLR